MSPVHQLDKDHFDGLVQHCSISIANAPEILQSCSKPSICFGNMTSYWMADGISQPIQMHLDLNVTRCYDKCHWSAIKFLHNCTCKYCSHSLRLVSRLPKLSSRFHTLSGTRHHDYALIALLVWNIDDLRFVIYIICAFCSSSAAFPANMPCWVCISICRIAHGVIFGLYLSIHNLFPCCIAANI